MVALLLVLVRVILVLVLVMVVFLVVLSCLFAHVPIYDSLPRTRHLPIHLVSSLRTFAKVCKGGSLCFFLFFLPPLPFLCNDVNPLRAPTSLPILTSSKFVPKKVSSTEGVISLWGFKGKRVVAHLDPTAVVAAFYLSCAGSMLYRYNPGRVCE